MFTTSPSLLQRLREPDEQRAWGRFVELYTPLLLAWARRSGLGPEDASDQVQEVFAHLVQKLPAFHYDPGKGAFRNWLRAVFVNKLRDRLRRHAHASRQADSGDLLDLVDTAGPAQIGEEEHNRYLVGRALELMQAEFEPSTWKACWEFVVNDRPAAEVAAELKMTPNAVFIAKWRVMRHLRQELAEFLD